MSPIAFTHSRFRLIFYRFSFDISDSNNIDEDFFLPLKDDVVVVVDVDDDDGEEEEEEEEEDEEEEDNGDNHELDEDKSCRC